MNNKVFNAILIVMGFFFLSFAAVAMFCLLFGITFSWTYVTRVFTVAGMIYILVISSSRGNGRVA